ncbi:UBX domain protein Ubx2 [Entomophthora muscae]|uniref:UBX domain protein Ubx2 n=1 Tax=Entomophthora muscae TaxID=34485 RepID=A0ACC2UIV1_9FUNG|nr:UBX domain protein Ubx2 [Entomophthora muscae]
MLKNDFVQPEFTAPSDLQNLEDPFIFSDQESSHQENRTEAASAENSQISGNQPNIPPISELFADDPAVLDLSSRERERNGGFISSVGRVDRNQPYIYQEAVYQPMTPWRDTPIRRAEHGPSSLPVRFRKASDEVAAHITLNDARRSAKRKNKFVLVAVFNFGNQQFMADILTLWDDKTLRKVLKDHFIVVQYHVDSTPGRDFCNFYPVRAYPHIAIIDPRTGERLKYWSKRFTVHSFTLQLKQFLNNNSLTGKLEYPSVQPAFSKEVDEMSEQEQLEAAIQASLGPSAAPAADPYESHVHILSDDDDIEDCVEPMEDDYEAASLSPQEIIQSLSPQDIPDASPEQASTRIQFRFPDGSRKVKCLSVDLLISSLYQYSKLFVPETAQDLELVCIREPLSTKLNESLLQAGLENSAITVTFIE